MISGRSGILWNAALRFFAPDNNAPKVTVRARGSLAGNVGPLMTLYVGGTAVSTVEVRSTTFSRPSLRIERSRCAEHAGRRGVLQ